MDFKEAAYQVLKQAKKPLSSRKITEIALRDNLISTQGKTPEASMRARLYLDIQRKGEKSKFIKVGKGVFGLKDWYVEDTNSIIVTGAASQASLSTADILKETQFKKGSLYCSRI
jgi:restriction system protein